MLWAHRTTRKSATQETPFALDFGIEAVAPVEVRLKVFPLTHTAPSEYVPSPVPSMGKTREQHNPHKGGTREKHNSYKQQSRETKRRPMTSKLTSRSDDQTLKLHLLRTQALSKVGRKMRAEYNSPHQRKAIIYEEARTPGEFTQFALIPHKPALKLCMLSPGKGY